MLVVSAANLYAPPFGAAFLEAISSVYGTEMTPERLLDATYRAHLLGFALEQCQGATLADYDMCADAFKGGAKGDLPGVDFLSRPLFEEIRKRVLDRFSADARAFGYMN